MYRTTISENLQQFININIFDHVSCAKGFIKFFGSVINRCCAGQLAIWILLDNLQHWLEPETPIMRHTALAEE